MSNRPNASTEERLVAQLQLARRPVAVSFRQEVSEETSSFVGQEPAGCRFWKLAAEGATFTTGPEAHYACAIGCYTHNIPLPETRAHELDETLSMMFDAGYLRPEEIPAISQLTETPEAITYGPLGEATFEPDVVLLVVRASQAMLLGEASARKGASAGLTLGARPTCMALPIALSNGMAASTGCVGNRVYTEIGEDDLYVAIRGDLLPGLVDALVTVNAANEALGEHHRAQKRAFAQRG